MPSQLRYSSSPSVSRSASAEIISTQPPQKKQKMSLTQTYYLAHSARAKLSKEAARADHNLRLLVGHANLLDSLMLDLAEAEREQESWFNQTVTKASQPSKHIQWADTLSEEEEEEDDYSWDGSDADDEEYSSSMSVPLRIAPTPSVSAVEVEEVDEETDDSEDDEDLALTRTSSRTPPELVHEHDSDSESDDDSLPPSPQSQIEIDFVPSKQVATDSILPKTAASSISPTADDDDFYAEGYFMPTTQQAVVRAY